MTGAVAGRSALKIHETLTTTGEAACVYLTVEDGALAIALDDVTFPLGSEALDAVMARYGGPVEPSERLIEVAAIALAGGRTVRHVRHLARYDVIARDFVVYDVPGRDSVCALAITVSAALAHLARATAAAR